MEKPNVGLRSDETVDKCFSRSRLGAAWGKSMGRPSRLIVSLRAAIKQRISQCNGSHCFPPKVSALSPAAFSEFFPV